MADDSARAQESFECFGVPVHVSVESDGSVAPMPPGWNRRAWFLHEGTLLGVEAQPSSPIAAAVEIEQVR